MYNIDTMSFIRKIKKNDRIYLAEVESKRVKGKVVQRFIRYVGKQADNKIILSSSASDMVVDSVKLHGPLLVLDHLAKEINLSRILGRYGDTILALVYAHCLDYKSVNYMRRWFEKTDLNMILDLEDLTEYQLYQAFDSLEEMGAENLQERIFQEVQKRYPINSEGVVYDVTNTYLYGNKCPLGKLGRSKDGKSGKPLIQIGMGVTRNKGIPVFHQVLDGNVHDARIFRDAIDRFQNISFKRGLVVYDRGVYSKDNLLGIKELKWDVICGVPIGGKLKAWLKKTLKKIRLVHYGNRVRLKNSVFYVHTVSYSICSIRGKLAVCFNDKQKQILKESRYDELAHAESMLRAGKRIKPGLEKYFDREGKLNLRVVHEEERMDGYSLLFTTSLRINKEEIVRLYFGKDIIERAFRGLKGITRVQPVRHWLYNRVHAHVFICYLSYLLLSLLRSRLDEIKVTPEQALRDLESLYKVYMHDPHKGFQLTRTVALTKSQENILRTIDKKLLLNV